MSGRIIWRNFPMGKDETLAVGYLPLPGKERAWQLIYDLPLQEDWARGTAANDQISIGSRDRKKAFAELRLKLYLAKNPSASSLHDRFRRKK